jgi:RNA polymerase sigma factor (sigma-70 family)
VAGLTDGQLLERFRSRDADVAERAFAALVERHGPLVLRVCRSVLRDPHEADDAFQAAFLVLARRSGSLWVRDSLGPWLHQVAYRVASSARSAAVRRRRHERRARELAGARVFEESPDDVAAVLHDELSRLPRGCRVAVMLCYFEGLSPAQAARQLDCPVGTVQSRLARGRERLRSRLIRRGVAPALAAAAAEATADAAPPALVVGTVRAALAGPASVPVIRLAQGALRAMLLINLRIVAAVVIAVAVLGAGAMPLLTKTPAPSPPRTDLSQVKSQRVALGANDAGRRDVPAEAGPPPADLAWADVVTGDRLRIVSSLAQQTRGNHEKIKTWRGSYIYELRQHLDERFVAEVLTGLPPNGRATPATARPGGLTQVFESVLTFALDTSRDALYRDVQTTRMRYLEPGTEKEVKIPNTGPADTRSIVTPTTYLIFDPRQRFTSALLPDIPEAQMKRQAQRFPAGDGRLRAGGDLDPRTFFKLDPGNFIWSSLEKYVRALRGDGRENVVAERLRLGSAMGPGGTWYRQQTYYTAASGPNLYLTILWSPEAGYNPVRLAMAFGRPDAPPYRTVEWRWKQIDGIYVPSQFWETVRNASDGALSRELKARLSECVLNADLPPHQFDEAGLGLSDGDLVVNYPERVAYLMKGGKPVRIAQLKAGPDQRPAAPTPRPSAPPAVNADVRSSGRIYISASLDNDRAGPAVPPAIAVDPETGAVTKVFDDSPGRLRISPDGRSAAYVSGDLSPTAPPPARFAQSLWIRPLVPGAEPLRVAGPEGAKQGDVPVWSSDGRQIILSVGARDEARKQWVFETFRINTDGSGREKLAIPPEDTVQDWSRDGAWVVTASSRNAKIGWQLYVMHPDGTDAQQITEGGNPFYARFSPDGRRLLYTDGTLRLPERQGIWVVDRDGRNRRRLLSTGKGRASACWSPDGRRVAAAVSGASPEEHGRLELVDLDGAHRTLISVPGQDIADMPDWR